MGDLSIRNLNDEIHAALRLEAAKAGVSVEEQARRAIAASVGMGSPAPSPKAARDEALRKMRADLRRLIPDPDRSIVDEFLAERRSMWGEE